MTLRAGVGWGWECQGAKAWGFLKLRPLVGSSKQSGSREERKQEEPKVGARPGGRAVSTRDESLTLLVSYGRPWASHLISKSVSSLKKEGYKTYVRRRKAGERERLLGLWQEARGSIFSQRG